ncbi:Pectinesterase inhibitor domain [Dillenia turbinata]|uniref:Pectinesterase inhibitor domain n=1 Tax=Dillenia turbinata TaxID=194707 RepID=A0AAN8UHK3_9MAGN
MYNEDTKKRKRYAIIGISSLLLVAMVIGATVGVGATLSKDSESDGSGEKPGITASVKAIKTVCQPTDYKETCESTLTAAAGNTTDPKELIKAAFKVTEKKISEGLQQSSVLQELEKDPRASKALATCKELMNSAIDDLKKSFNHLGSFDFSKAEEMLEDMKIWLSSTITDQETCLDGFQNTTSSAGEKMKAVLKTARELTSNGLAMVSEISSVLGDLNIQIPTKRRLLNDDASVLGHGGVPLWFNNAEQRKLLQVAANNPKPDFVVAKDGSSKYNTINSVLKDLPKNSKKTIVVYIKEGIYEEQVVINKTLTNLMMVGAGAEKTKITGKLNWKDGTPTYKTATVG